MSISTGKAILEELMRHLGFDVQVEVETGETSRLNVVGAGEEREALGALIGRKGERLSALQHLVNLMLSRRMGDWTRVLVDVEDYRGRRERQLRDLAMRAAERVAERISVGEKRDPHELVLLDADRFAAASFRALEAPWRGAGVGEERERRGVVLVEVPAARTGRRGGRRERRRELREQGREVDERPRSFCDVHRGCLLAGSI